MSGQVASSNNGGRFCYDGAPPQGLMPNTWCARPSEDAVYSPNNNYHGTFLFYTKPQNDQFGESAMAQHIGTHVGTWLMGELQWMFFVATNAAPLCSRGCY
eukprot:226893-Amphidinium_carterae.1